MKNKDQLAVLESRLHEFFGGEINVRVYASLIRFRLIFDKDLPLMMCSSNRYAFDINVINNK